MMLKLELINNSRYAGRPSSASTATGSKYQHMREQEGMLNLAFS